MNPLRPAYLKIATISVALSLVLAASAVSFWQLSALGIILKVGIINSLVSLFWLFFEKIGWRTAPCKWIPGLNIPPDLRGRWEGELQRVGTPEKVTPFVVEISQTYSSIKITGFGSKSRSRSFTATILTDEHASEYEIIYTWCAETRRENEIETTDEYYGTSIAKLETTNTATLADRELVDHYFTRRNPQTRGHTVVKWKQLKLLNRF